MLCFLRIKHQLKWNNVLDMGLFERIRESFGSKDNSSKVVSDDLETEQQYKERWRSIYIIYFTMFLISLGFSIIVTGVWPYLDEVSKIKIFVLNLINCLSYLFHLIRYCVRYL